MWESRPIVNLSSPILLQSINAAELMRHTIYSLLTYFWLVINLPDQFNFLLSKMKLNTSVKQKSKNQKNQRLLVVVQYF